MPRWYLSRFASNAGRLFVVDRQIGRTYSSTVTKIGVEVGYYDVNVPGVPRDVVESEVLAPIERYAARAVDRLTLVGPAGLTVNERRNIAAFVAAQMLRGKDVQAASEQIAAGLLRAQIAGMTESQIITTAQEAGVAMTPDDVRQMREAEWSASVPGASVALLMQHLEGFTNVLAGAFDWVLLTFDEPWVLTSDVPVVMTRTSDDAGFFGGIGLFSADRIEIPIDPRSVLRLESHVATGAHVAEETRAGDLGELNELLKSLMLQSHRWTFLHPDHPARHTMPIPPPPGDRVSGFDELAELTRRMREAHE